jgi:large subunit ribosomal protein L5
MVVRFEDLYKQQVKENLQKKFDFKNRHQIPKIEKVIINMGVGEAVQDSKVVNNAVKDLTKIAGQKAVITQAKKSEASFKLRKGMNVGCKVTLRKTRMYEFLERLVYIALPRLSGFKGFDKKSFDGRGNFNFGIKEHIIFPEIDYDKVDKIRGMDITIVTDTTDNEEAKALFNEFNLPFIN